MNDNEAVKRLTEILKRYPLTEKEQEAVRDAIGILSWTKLVEGMKENMKRARDRKLED